MRIEICDVGPRDGLQNDPKILEPDTRAELVNRLASAGLPRIETVSFVNPARVPQMAGAEEVVAAIDRVPGVVYAGLVLNEKGYDRLAATDLDEAHFAFAATETFNEAVRPLIGRLTMRSQCSRTSRPSPRPSPPTTTARGGNSEASW